MNYKNQFNAFVSGSNGVFKGVKLTNKECIQKCVQNIGSITSDSVVTAMSWGDENENDILMACGTENNNRSFKVYNAQIGVFQDSRTCNIGEGKTIGISRYDETVITAVESGQLILWPKNELEQGKETVLEAEKDLYRMRHSPFEKHIVATGGEENPLKLFDLAKQEITFTAKNVRNDSLELRVPVSIKDIGFLNNTNVVTVGKYGHVRLYDPKAQRRPVINVEIKDEALMNLAVCPRERKIIVGSGKGVMKLVDLRKPGKILNTYKGSAGGVTAISCSKTNPYVVSVGLDRFLRVHNIETKNEIRRAYLTSKTTCMLLRSDFTLEETEEVKDEFIVDDEIEVLKRENGAEDDEDRDSEYEEIFDNMETIGDKRKKTPKTVKQSDTSKRRKSDTVNETQIAKLRKNRK